MTEPFSITDRRASSGVRRTSSGLYAAGANFDAVARDMRSKGFPLPNSNVQARITAKQVVTDVRERGTVTDVQNRAMAASMRQDRMQRASSRMAGPMTRTGANTQMVLPKVRQPMSSLLDKGIPFNVQDPKELIELRRWCNTPDAPVWMADYTFKAIGDIKPGDQVIGWITHPEMARSGRRELTPTTVLAVNRRIAPEVVLVTFASGRTVKCTPDHQWLRYYAPGPDGRILNGPEKSRTVRFDSDYAPLQVGSIARSVITPTQPLATREQQRAADYLAGILDGEGCWNRRTIRVCQSPKVNPGICERIDWCFEVLGLDHKRYVRTRHDASHHGGEMVIWEMSRGGLQTGKAKKNRQQLVDFFNWARPVKMDQERMDRSLLSKNFGEPDEVVSIESLGPGEVISMQTATGNYTAWGYASKNCRLFYSTHPLVPLLIDMYSKFPVTGLEFVAKDPKIEQFYESMFLDDLGYEEFLPDGLLREYFMVGEVSALAHFNEQLGIFSSEEILNPDMVRVSKSLFVEQERVQLVVKELVESLRTGPMGISPSEESPSEKQERVFEYQQLVQHYPEIIKAAMQDDGLDISDALVSRMANKAAWWDLRGTPHLLRCFRTLMMEESLNCAQDAVADRLYAPMILATLGIEGAMGDGEPWIPDQGELEDLRDDIQSALAGDFKLLVHNFGLQVTSVFGRESVPRFDTDYDRVDSQIMQAWGVGQGLIQGGSGAGSYAGDAINREVCEQLMRSAQLKAIRHMRKRMEVIAEAQEHYDFELKGGIRKPIYREIVQFNEETGEEEIVRVPKLLIPEIRFATLNLRDEATERAFYAQLKQLGVPVSDKSLAINIPFEFKEELERQAQETVDKGMAQSEAMHVLQTMCDEQGLAYPAELAQFLQATLTVRAGLAQTEMAESQNKMIDQQMSQSSPAGMMGLLPGTTMQPLAGTGAPGALGDPNAGASPGGAPPPAEAPSDAQPGATADPTLGAGAPMVATATMHGPRMMPPGGPVSMDDDVSAVEVPRNRQRPEESDEMRAGMPKKVGQTQKRDTSLPGRGDQSDPILTKEARDQLNTLTRMTRGPSSYRKSRTADDRRIERAVRRRELLARGGTISVEDLVNDPEAFDLVHMEAFEAQLRADLPELLAGGGSPESRRLLEEFAQQYEEVTGVSVTM